MVGSREISVSSCPEAIADMLESGKVDLKTLSPDDKLRYQLMVDHLQEQCPQERKPTFSKEPRFDRLQRIHKQNPGCDLCICRVDTEGDFVYENKNYRVDSTQGKYAPHPTRYGDQYDMDRIIVIHLPDGSLQFADQDGHLLEDQMVTALVR